VWPKWAGKKLGLQNSSMVYWVGTTDAEGCFLIQTKNKSPGGVQFFVFFKITLHIYVAPLLLFYL
jgi:hypothetical protein